MDYHKPKAIEIIFQDQAVDQNGPETGSCSYSSCCYHSESPGGWGII